MTLPAQDIVERLLSNAEAHFRGVPLARRITGQQLSEAADTISRLTADNEALRKERDEARAEIERMTPKFVAYEYLEAPDQREASEARADALAQEVERLRLIVQEVAEFNTAWIAAAREDIIQRARAALGERE